jgi:hypothetical protein
MTTSVPTGEGGQQRQQRSSQQKKSVGSSDTSVPSIRDIVCVVGYLVAAVVLVTIVVAYVWGNSPVGIQNRAQAERLIRAELGALPPYPDSTLVAAPLVMNTWDRPVSVTGTYSMTPGACRSVNAYYADLASRHGWQVTRPLTAGSDQGTTLSTFFGKMAGGYTLEMTVECRDSDNTYDVSIDP